MFPRALENMRSVGKLWSAEARRLVLIDCIAFILFYSTVIFLYDEDQLLEFSSGNIYLTISDFKGKYYAFDTDNSYKLFPFIYPLYPLTLMIAKFLCFGKKYISMTLVRLVLSSLTTFSYNLILRAYEITKRYEGGLLTNIVTFLFFLQSYSLSNQSLFFILICMNLFYIKQRKLKHFIILQTCMILTHRDGILFVISTILSFTYEKLYKTALKSCIALLAIPVLFLYDYIVFKKPFIVLECYSNFFNLIPFTCYFDLMLKRMIDFACIDMPLFLIQMLMCKDFVFKKCKAYYFFIYAILIQTIMSKFDSLAWEYSYIGAFCIGLEFTRLFLPEKPSHTLRHALMIIRFFISIIVPYLLSSKLIDFDASKNVCIRSL